MVCNFILANISHRMQLHSVNYDDANLNLVLLYTVQYLILLTVMIKHLCDDRKLNIAQYYSIPSVDNQDISLKT